jgi:ubiquitin carboxyl-terminal hydrolase 4/11/15
MKKGQKAIYDLYAVSNHFGSLNGGHYTAFARNPISNKWNDFDDSNVNKMSPGDVNSKAAYVLFYKRRL